MVSDEYALVAHAAAPRVTVPDRSVTPKLKPKSVMDAEPSRGAFDCWSDVTAGALYETTEREVPTNEDTVTDMDSRVPAPAGAMQLKADRAVQLTVAQLVRPTRTETLKSTIPKFVPITLSVAAPVVGMFGRSWNVTTGGSYEKRVPAVPTCSEIERVTYNCDPEPVGEVQATEVLVVQVVLAQIWGPILAVAVTSKVAKLAPLSVTGMVALGAALLGFTVVTMGAPYVYAFSRVPICPAWETTKEARPAPGEETHTSAELEVHDAVAHADRPMRPVADRSTVPKFVPKTVTESPPLMGATNEASTLVSTGASYENAERAVAAESTVDMSTVLDTPTEVLVCRHATDESVVQEVVAQSMPPTEIVCVLSMGTKFSPSRVMEVVEVEGTFGATTAVMAGES